MGVINSDPFILISGDVISNMDLKKAIEFHPDKNPDDKIAEANFKKAAEAYEVLGNQEKRSKYDQFGHAAFEGGQGFGQGMNMDDIFSQFGDIFGSAFGGGFGGGWAQHLSRNFLKSLHNPSENASKIFQNPSKTSAKPIQNLSRNSSKPFHCATKHQIERPGGMYPLAPK